MNDFIKELSSLTRTPEDIERAECEANAKYNQACQSSIKVYANELARLIKEDIKTRAINADYKLTSNGKLICGTISAIIKYDPDFNKIEDYHFIDRFYYPSSLDKGNYLSYFLSLQNLKYKKGLGVFRGVNEYTRTDKIMITPLGKQIIDELKRILLNHNIKVSSRIVVKHSGSGVSPKINFYDNQDSVIVSQGFSEYISIDGCIYYEIEY